jgi:hypothetical protein
MMGRRSAGGERAEIMELILSKILGGSAGTRRAAALRGGWRAVLGKLVCLLLGVEHHLLISPLCKLSVMIEIRARGRNLSLLRRMDWVWLLVGVLIEGSGIEWLCMRIPTRLLLLDGVGIMRGLWRSNLRGRRGGISRRGHALARNR